MYNYKFELITGPMSCGKTEELLRRLRRAVIAGRRIKVFSPLLDTRVLADCIESRNGSRSDAIKVRNAGEILDYINEFIEYNSQIHGTGSIDRDLNNGKTFEEWLEHNLNLHNEEYAKSIGMVPSYTYLFVRDSDNKIVGMIDFRHYLNDFLRTYGGHIGYSIRPTERRKGYNKYNLYLVLKEADKLGLDKVLIICADYNEGSRNTILSFDGEYEKTNFFESANENLELYWVDVKHGIEKYKDVFEN